MTLQDRFRIKLHFPEENIQASAISVLLDFVEAIITTGKAAEIINKVSDFSSYPIIILQVQKIIKIVGATGH